VSRSTDASKGVPDDDEGRLPDDAESGSSAHPADDAAEPGEQDADEIADAPADAADDAGETVDDAESDEEREPATAAAGGRTSARAAGAASAAKVPTKRTAGKPAPRQKNVAKRERSGPFAAIALFVRQVISELRKVVTPTGRELGTYVAVVIVFVLIVMAYVGVLDFAVGKLVLWAFGG
jgi:preprotein translocase subunit SecE